MTPKNPLAINADRNEVRVFGKLIKLTPKEYKLLLLRESNKTMSREQLLQAIWPIGKFDVIDTRTVDQHIARLRRKLGARTKLIETVTAFGYKYIGA